jgi:hypothetical protein
VNDTSGAAYPVAPRSDLRFAFGWIAIGALAVFGAWHMDRLEQQGAQLFTAPGLWPGIVGFVIAMLGGVLAVRSLRRAREAGWAAADADDAELAPASHFATATAMFFAYAVLLVGHGLPFWLGTLVFVTAYVFWFRRASRMLGDGAGTPRGDLVLALCCGAATAAVVPLVFEKLFFVRLP